MIVFELENLADMNGELKAFMDFLKECRVDEDGLYASRLVSCELLSNVIRHCGERAHFEGGLAGGEVEIRVSSPHSVWNTAALRLPDVFAESGRGLYIINALCRGNVRVVDNEIRAFIKIERQ